MSSIDKRIVQMQFDNQNFESGVSKTMNSLQQLNEKLKMKDSSKGLDGVNESLTKLSGFGVSGLATGVETVTAKFSALGVIGMTALSNITNSAINTGKQLLKSLTIDPIKTGFSEYETKMGSIQTILTNTSHQGTTLEDVNKVLAELNEYSDQTIYNFAEMARNIGTFTAAGVDLDTSAAAIKGIANLAAASGSSSAQASSAMYQLSQALAAGRVSLMDWQSVVTAGMGGKLFQDALIRTSEVMGTGAETMIKKYGSFRDSLTQGQWLTTEVLTETLKQLSGAYTEADLVAQGYTESQAQQIIELSKNATAAATEVKTVSQLVDTMKESVQSGWAISWEHIIGDKGEATKVLTGIKDGFDALIKPSTDARNKMLEFWNEAGGRDDVIKGFTNIFQSLGKGFKSVGEAWNEVFPSMSGEKLVELSGKFKDFTENFKMGDETANKLKNTFKGVFTVFDTVKDAVVGLVKGFTPLLGLIKPIGSGFLTITSSIGSFVSKIGEAADKSKVFDKIGNGIKTAFEAVGSAVGSALSTAGNKVTEFISKMNIGNVFDNTGKAFSRVGEVISKVASGIGQAIGSINFETITNIVKTLVGAGIFTTLKSVFDEFKNIGDDLTGVFDSFKGIGEGVSGVLDSVKNSLTSWQNSLNAGTLIKLASAIGILAAALLALSTIETGDLATALAGMAVVFAELTLAMAAINKIGNIKGLTKTSASMNLMATAMLILAGALKILSSIPIDEMVVGLVGLAASLGLMVAAVKLFSTTSSGLAKTSASLIIFGAAMKVMASAIEQIGSIDTETLGAGLFGLAGALTELALFLAAAKFGNLSLSSAAGILTLSAALVVLSQAMKQFGEMETDNIIRGLVGIAAVLTEIAVFAKLGGSGLQMTTLAIGLTVMSAAILLLSQAVESMGSISWEGIARGLTSLAGALTILGVASALVSGVQMTLLAVGLGAMSVALMGLSTALNMMSGQSWEEIGKSMVTLAGSLTILAVAMYAMTGCIPGAAAMLVMAAAMAVFTPQLIALSQLSLEQIGTGLLALAGAFTVVGVAGVVLGLISPLLLAFAAAVALVGVGVAAAGAGMLAFGTGITAVAAAVGTSGAVMISFAKELIALLPQLGLKAGEAMVNFAGAFSKGAPQIIAALTTLLDAILTSIQNNIPKIAETGVDIVVAFAAKLAEGVPKIVESGIKMVKGILDGIARNIQGVVESGIQCVVAFINGVANKLPAVIQAAINLALSFIEGVADGLMSNQARLESAISKIIQAMIKTGISIIKGGISGFTSGGKELLQGLCNGVKSMASAAGTAVKNCIDAAKRAASNLGSSLVSAGKSLIQGLITGITSMASSVASKAKSVVEGAINAAKKALKINSPSKVFIEIGKYVDEGFIVGMERYASNVANTAGDISKNVIDSFSEPLSNVNELINSDIISDPVITPVLDLSNVQTNARRLNSMLPGSGNIILSTDAANIMTNTMGKVQNGTSNGEIVAALNELKDNMVGGTNTSYTINGITYDNGSSIANAVEALVRAARIERRV